MAESSIVPSMISAMGPPLPGARPKFHAPVVEYSVKSPDSWPTRLIVPPVFVNVPWPGWGEADPRPNCVKWPPRLIVPWFTAIVPVLVHELAAMVNVPPGLTSTAAELFHVPAFWPSGEKMVTAPPLLTSMLPVVVTIPVRG